MDAGSYFILDGKGKTIRTYDAENIQQATTSELEQRSWLNLPVPVYSIDLIPNRMCLIYKNKGKEISFCVTDLDYNNDEDDLLMEKMGKKLLEEIAIVEKQKVVENLDDCGANSQKMKL
jgi:hypothetical protein